MLDKPYWNSLLELFSATGNEEVLNQLMYPILDDSICANHWDDFLPATELCAGYENQRKDFCGVRTSFSCVFICTHNATRLANCCWININIIM